MSRQIFINLPVKDLEKSVDFFSRLGFDFNPDYTDQNATCMIISDNIFVMLLVEDFFQTFTQKEIADARSCTEAILALPVEHRGEVDELVGKAVDAGGTAPNDKQEHGWMYGWGFQDLDGHLWEVFYADEQARAKESQ